MAKCVVPTCREAFGPESGAGFQAGTHRFYACEKHAPYVRVAGRALGAAAAAGVKTAIEETNNRFPVIRQAFEFVRVATAQSTPDDNK